MHMDSLGLIWSHLNWLGALGSTWAHLISFGLDRINMHWLQLNSLGLSWLHLDWLSLHLLHSLDWFSFTWIHLSSLEFICLVYIDIYIYILKSILSKWIQVSPGGSKWTKSVQVNPNQSKWVHVNQSESKHACTGTWDPFHLGLDPGLALWILGWAGIGRNSKNSKNLKT